MDRSALAENLRDVTAGLLTPSEEDDPGMIRFDKLAGTAEWLHEGGIDLFLACTNISEYHSLTHDERVESVRVAHEALPKDATVLGGAGGSTKTSIDLARARAPQCRRSW